MIPKEKRFRFDMYRHVGFADQIWGVSGLSETILVWLLLIVIWEADGMRRANGLGILDTLTLTMRHWKFIADFPHLFGS